MPEVVLMALRARPYLICLFPQPHQEVVWLDVSMDEAPAVDILYP